MQLRSDQWLSHLNHELAPLYVLYGNAPLLILEAVDQLRQKTKEQGYSEREILIVAPGFDWDTLELAHKHLSLFGEKKLIDLRIPSGKPGKEGSEALQRLAERSNPDVITLITLPELDWATQKSSWFDALKNKAALLELNMPDRNELPRWIAERLARQKQRANKEALALLADCVEGNLLAAHQEIQKLSFLYPEGELSLNDIQKAVLHVARYDVFSLNEALLTGNISRLARMLNGLRAEGEAPPLVLWAMTEEIRTLIQIQQGKKAGKPLTQLFRDNRVWGIKQKLIEQALKRISLSQLEEGLKHAAQIDRMIKGVMKGDVWDAFLQLGLRFKYS